MSNNEFNHPFQKTFLREDALNMTSDSSYEECRFEGVDFSKYNLHSVSFLDCVFLNCNLANASMTNTTMRSVSFESCNLMGINWCNLKKAEDLSFEKSKLNFSVFQRLKMKKTKLKDCQAVDVDFSEADLTGADLSGSVLSGANFNKAILAGVDFRKCRDFLFDIRVTNIKGAKFSFPEVVSLITVLGAEVQF